MANNKAYLAENISGFVAPARISLPYWSTYLHIPTGKNYRQLDPGTGSNWVEVGLAGTGKGGGGGADGNGIYSGSGFLPEDVVVGMDTYKLQFDSPGVTGLFTVDGPTGNIGFGIDTPAHGVHVKTGNMFIDQGTLAVGATTPSNSYGILTAVDDTNGNNVRGQRIVLANETTTGAATITGMEVRTLNNKLAPGTNNYRGVDVNFTGGATEGTYNMIGMRVKMDNFNALGEVTINKYLLELINGTEGAGKVLTSDANGLANWADPAGGEPANAVYASPTGDDGTGERGNPNRPFLTLGAARDAAVAGDTIFVASGSYTANTVLLGKNLVDWDFAVNTFVTPSNNLNEMWQDNFSWSYRVKGYGNFGSAVGEATNYIVNFFASNSNIEFECATINHPCNQAVVKLANNGKFKAHGTVNNANTGDIGGVLWTTGFGNLTVEAKLWSTQVNGNTLFNSPNGTYWYNAGFTGTMYLKGRFENYGTTKSGSCVQSATGSNGTVYADCDFIDNASTATTFYSAAILYGAGKIIHKGDITKANGSGFYTNNSGVVNEFTHKEGTYDTANGDTVRLHDALGNKEYQFDGAYSSDGLGVNTFNFSGNNGSNKVYIGKDSRAYINPKAAAGVGVNLSSAIPWIFGDATIICDDGAGGTSINAGAATTVQINGKVTSNVDKDANVTPIDANSFDFNALYQL